MDGQLSLFDSAPPPQAGYSFFLALQPDSETATDIHRLASDLKAVRGLRGSLRPLDHLHVTLHYLGSEASPSVVYAVDRACSEVASRTPVFDVRFAQILGFQARPGNYPFVLAGADDANSELKTFHRQLAGGLAVHGVRVIGDTRRFVPHLTLQYTRDLVSPESIDPIQWRVRDLVLIRSEVGATRYEYLGRWSLQGE